MRWRLAVSLPSAVCGRVDFGGHYLDKTVQVATATSVKTMSKGSIVVVEAACYSHYLGAAEP